MSDARSKTFITVADLAAAVAAHRPVVVLDVRDMNELMPMEVEDVPNGIIEQERAIQAAAERVGGLADTAIGVQSTEKRTLGENQLAASGSAIRVKEPIEYLSTAVESVMRLRHAIWVRALKADPRGMEAPQSIASRLEVGGTPLIDGRFTGDAISGDFQFTLHGSVQSADPQAMRADFNESLKTLQGLGGLSPAFQMMLQSPDVVKTIAQQWARVYRVPNADAFLKALQQAQAQMQQQAEMQAQQAEAMAQAGLPMAPGAAPGGPPGLPPAPQGAPPSGIAGLLAQLGGQHGVQ